MFKLLNINLDSSISGILAAIILIFLFTLKIVVG